MGLLPFFKKKPLFSKEENDRIVAAIRASEMRTSGEIRVYIEAKNPYVSPMERAMEIFLDLKMQETEHRNGVLLYVAHKHHELALFADEGIYNKAGKQFWEDEVSQMIKSFSKDNIADGVEQCVLDIGDALHSAFPYMPLEDRNELPDDIVFGKM